MPRKATKHDVQLARSEWYAHHYESRATVKAMATHELHTLQHIANQLPPPEMTVFGGTPRDWLTPEVFRLAYVNQVDVNLVCPWYLSDAGWDQFQELWKQLPEPVDLYTEGCVQVGELFHLSTADEIQRPANTRR
jgi:hypothetical protein